MNILIGVVVTTLLIFTFRLVYKWGFKKGARMVLEQWKDEVRNMEEIDWAELKK